LTQNSTRNLNYGGGKCRRAFVSAIAQSLEAIVSMYIINNIIFIITNNSSLHLVVIPKPRMDLLVY
jgi:hypothetical protein